MNICIVTPSFNGGGAEKIAVNLSNYYSENGYDVTLVAFRAIGPYVSHVSSKVRIVDLDSRGRYVFVKLLLEIKRSNFDVVFSVIRESNILVGLVSFFIPMKLLCREANTMHGVDSKPFMSRLAYRLLMRCAYSRAVCVVANSQDTKNDLLKLKITNESKCCVIGNPVLPNNINELCSEYIEHAWINNPMLKVVLNVGRLHKQKNHKLLIESFARVCSELTSVRLIILGEGDERNNILKLAKCFNVLDLIDVIDFKENPYPYYKNSDLFVLTSDWEGFGNVLVEAMACEIPVISTRCPGGPSTILSDGDFGTLVSLDNADELSNEMIKSLTNDKDKCLLKKAKQRSQNFSVPYISELYLASVVRKVF